MRGRRREGDVGSVLGGVRGGHVCVSEEALAVVVSGVNVSGSQQENPHVQRFRGLLVFKAHRLLYHSPSGSRVIHKNSGEGRCSRSKTVHGDRNTKP